MEQEEQEDYERCCDCGAALLRSSIGAFPVNDTLLLCLDCAFKRGGVYDPTTDDWNVLPDIADLPDERRSHP